MKRTKWAVRVAQRPKWRPGGRLTQNPVAAVTWEDRDSSVSWMVRRWLHVLRSLTTATGTTARYLDAPLDHKYPMCSLIALPIQCPPIRAKNPHTTPIPASVHVTEAGSMARRPRSDRWGLEANGGGEGARIDAPLPCTKALRCPKEALRSTKPAISGPHPHGVGVKEMTGPLRVFIVRRCPRHRGESHRGGSSSKRVDCTFGACVSDLPGQHLTETIPYCTTSYPDGGGGGGRNAVSGAALRADVLIDESGRPLSARQIKSERGCSRPKDQILMLLRGEGMRKLPRRSPGHPPRIGRVVDLQPCLGPFIPVRFVFWPVLSLPLGIPFGESTPRSPQDIGKGYLTFEDR